MIRWPFRYKPDRAAREGKELAKQQLTVAKAIEHAATELEREHQEILRRNNLGPKIHRALGGH